MPLVEFSSLPPDARVWVFAASDPLASDRATTLLAAADAYLAGWKAHGEPLTCARDWRDDRFLGIGVDQSTAGASGCSIDGLFRTLQGMQGSLGTALVGAARIFYRDAGGGIVCVDRATFTRRAAEGGIGLDTPVFDLTVTTADAYRRQFETSARNAWHAELFGKAAVK